MVVLDHSSCGITETARITRWMANESAGQCGPCVYGLPALADDLERLARGEARGRVDAQLSRHLDSIAGRGACAHPDGVVRMVRSALSVFAPDLAGHLAGRPCSAMRAATVLELPPNEGVIEWR
jgi:NADH:ubiquinone oxidoreductase subunit F (NADH-binding)